MATATTRIAKRDTESGAGRAKARAAAAIAAGPTAADCRRVADRLKMAADGTRVGILLALADGERNVSDMMGRLGMSQPALSHHLSIMRMSGTVASRREGKSNFYHMTARGRSLLSAVTAIMQE
jgi:ArsR family transcriptional regulator